MRDGGTINLLAYTLPRVRDHATFVKPRDLDGFGPGDPPETKLVIGEVLGNPGLGGARHPGAADITASEKCRC